MANVLVPFPGASAEDVEQLVAIPAEQVLSQIQGLEHVWSVSRPGQAVITVQYKVGVPRTEAIVRLHDTILSHRDWLPPELNVGEPLVKPKGIDDVPIVSLTLWTSDPDRGAFELERVAHAVEVELKRVPGTREVTTIGGPGRVVQVRLDVDKLHRARPCRPASLKRMLQRRQRRAAGRHDRPRQRDRAGRDRRVPRRTRSRSATSSSASTTASRSTCPTSRASSTGRRTPARFAWFAPGKAGSRGAHGRRPRVPGGHDRR